MAWSRDEIVVVVHQTRAMFCFEYVVSVVELLLASFLLGFVPPWLRSFVCDVDISAAVLSTKSKGEERDRSEGVKVNKLLKRQVFRKLQMFSQGLLAKFKTSPTKI